MTVPVPHRDNTDPLLRRAHVWLEAAEASGGGSSLREQARVMHRQIGVLSGLIESVATQHLEHVLAGHVTQANHTLARLNDMSARWARLRGSLAELVGDDGPAVVDVELPAWGSDTMSLEVPGSRP